MNKPRDVQKVKNKKEQKQALFNEIRNDLSQIEKRKKEAQSALSPAPGSRPAKPVNKRGEIKTPNPGNVKSDAPLKPPVFQKKNSYALFDFISQVSNDDLILYTYRALLGRNPLVQERQQARALLQKNFWGPLELLLQVRYSREGRKKRVPVEKLTLLKYLSRLPLGKKVLERKMTVYYSLANRAQHMKSELYTKNILNYNSSALKENFENQISQKEKRIEQLNENIKLLTSDVNKQTGFLGKLDDSLKNMEKQIEDNRYFQKYMEDTVTVNRLQSNRDMARHEDIIHRLRNRGKALQEEMSEFSAKIPLLDSLGENVDQVRKSIVSQSKILESHETRMVQMKEKAEAQHKSIQTHETRIVQMKEKTDAQDKSIHAHETRIAQMKEKAETQDKSIHAHETRITQLKERTDAQHKSIQAHESRIAQMRETIDKQGKLLSLMNDSFEKNRLKMELSLKELNDLLRENMREMMDRWEQMKTSLSGDQGSQKIEKINMEMDHYYDTLYEKFENRFRGERADILNRLTVYLPYLDRLKEKEKKPSAIDIGCGRGEWLELLKQEKINAYGIDKNQSMVRQCQEIGLDVRDQDAFESLKDLKKNSLDMITAFHFIEHFAFEDIVKFYDYCYRALKPGGMVIFETPNPENILVSSFFFYTDMTHIRPLVPETMQFVLKDRGFSKVELLRLHSYQEMFGKKPHQDKFINEWFYNEMDYAVIGYK